jgi:hypothetical protein
MCLELLHGDKQQDNATRHIFAIYRYEQAKT